MKKALLLAAVCATPHIRSDHDVRIAMSDQAGRVTNGVSAGSAGRDDRVIRPLQAMTDRHLAGCQVDQGRRNKERRDTLGPLVAQLQCGVRDDA